MQRFRNMTIARKIRYTDGASLLKMRSVSLSLPADVKLTVVYILLTLLYKAGGERGTSEGLEQFYMMI